MTRDNGIVDLFIAGQPKSGTTALRSYLAQHPDICMSTPKEPNYFATDLIAESDAFHGRKAYYHIRSLDAYRSLFDHDRAAAYWGEASVNYLYSAEAPRRIHEHNPRAIIVVSLRDPVSMMWSLHRQYLNETSENEPDFLIALEKETRRKMGDQVPNGTRCPSLLFYSERVKYAEHLARYLDLFSPEQMVVTTVEELRQNGAGICREIFERLGADTSFVPIVEPVHERQAPRFTTLNKRLRSPRLTKTIHRVTGPRLYAKLQKQFAERVLLKPDPNRGIPEDVREVLRDQVRPEVEKVSDLLGRDLVTAWGYQTPTPDPRSTPAST